MFTFWTRKAGPKKPLKLLLLLFSDGPKIPKRWDFKQFVQKTP